MAHDATIPGNKKLSAHAERSNGIVIVGCKALLTEAGLPPPYWTYAVRYFCLCYNVQPYPGAVDGDNSWRKRFKADFSGPLLPFGSLVKYMPPPESRYRVAKTGQNLIVGVYLGYVHKAGGCVGPDSYVVPLRQLDGLNMVTGRTPAGKRPIIEKSDQVYSAILNEDAPDRTPQFPMKAAFDEAMTKVKSVTIPWGRATDVS